MRLLPTDKEIREYIDQGEIPDRLQCPIGFNVVVDPVRSPHNDKRVFERRHLLRALRHAPVDPLCRMPLDPAQVLPAPDAKFAARAFRGVVAQAYARRAAAPETSPAEAAQARRLAAAHVLVGPMRAWIERHQAKRDVAVDEQSRRERWREHLEELATHEFAIAGAALGRIFAAEAAELPTIVHIDMHVLFSEDRVVFLHGLPEGREANA